MTVSLELGWLVAAVLISVRVAAATALTSVLGPLVLPGSARVLLAAALAVLLVSAKGITAAPPQSIIGLGIACVREVLIGAMFAAGFLAAAAAAQVAGRLLDTQMGFGVAGIFNPLTSATSPLTGAALGMVLVSAFLAVDGHHVLLRILAQSVDAIPPGGAPGSLPEVGALIEQSARMFGYGLALAAPVTIALLLADVGLSIVARSMPQLNIFVFGFPIKIMLGLVGLAISVRWIEPILSALFGATFRYWHGAAGT